MTTHRPTVLNICTRVYAIRDKRCEVLDEVEIENGAGILKKAQNPRVLWVLPAEQLINLISC